MSDPDHSSPVLMQVDNFTSLSKTPWAGTGIYAHFKKHLLGNQKESLIGESWEFSADPGMPSQCPGLGMGLQDFIKNDPASTLGSKFEKEGCNLLVKLISAADPLSFQVHPCDDDPNLKPGECGKPESWLILDRDPGAGIYLGFRPGIKKSEFSHFLRQGEDLRGLMQFVPVEPGDFFNLPPHVPHAIGGGVTLLEPQRVAAGAAGKTFRMWDWGRRYAPDGRVDMQRGVPRPLHIEESLDLVNPEIQSGERFLKSLRRVPILQKLGNKCNLFEYPDLQYYQVSRLLCDEINGRFRLAVPHAYAVIFVAAGKIEFVKNASHKTFLKGQTLFLPSKSLPAIVDIEGGSDLIIMTQGNAKLSVELN